MSQAARALQWAGAQRPCACGDRTLLRTVFSSWVPRPLALPPESLCHCHFTGQRHLSVATIGPLFSGAFQVFTQPCPPFFFFLFSPSARRREHWTELGGRGISRHQTTERAIAPRRRATVGICPI